MVKKFMITVKEGYAESFGWWTNKEHNTVEDAEAEILRLLELGCYPTYKFSIIPVYRND